MEGGGDSADDKASLRRGMSELLGALREAARQERLHWKVVPCGGRNATYDAFLNATKTWPDTVNVLVIDSEAPVANLNLPRTHLKQRDGWDLAAIQEDSIHLMIQVMDTWIIADADALANYCEQHFQKRALPQTQNLEGIEKEQIYNALERATARTQKGAYRRIRHAADLFANIDPVIVRRRCPSCGRLFVTLAHAIDAS